MSKWIIDTEETMSTLWLGTNPDLVFERLSGTTWALIGVPTYIGDNIHSLSTAFTEAGDYLIRVRDINTNVSIYDKLVVNKSVPVDSRYVKDTNYKVSHMLKNMTMQQNNFIYQLSKLKK